MKEIVERLKDNFGEKILNTRTHSPKRIYIDIDPADIRPFVSFMMNAGIRFATATGIDTPDGFEIIYHFDDDSAGKIVSLRVIIKGKEKPEIDSISNITKAAEWIEREIWEMFGINFRGHPDLRRLLLAPDWPDGVYPMRKDYILPEHERELEI